MKKIFCVPFLFLLTSNTFSQWMQTSGPAGGGASDFAFIDGKILAATFDLGNGVFISTDDGSSWHESGLQGIMLTHITAFGNTVITASTQNSSNETDAVYRSNDDGSTWQKVLTLNNISGVRSICHYQEKWYLSVQGQEGGLYLSYDDGLTWVKNIPKNFNFTRPVPLISSDSYLIAGSDKLGIPTVFRTPDGQSWTPYDSLIPRVYTGTASGNTIWLGVTGGVIYSNSGGFLWSRPTNLGLELPRSEYIASLVASGNHLVAISSLNTIYYSWNAGDNWTKLSGNGLPTNASYFFSLAVNNGKYYLGASSGTLSSSDGSHWHYSTDGLRAAAISELAFSNGKIFTETERGVSYSVNAGSSWHDPENLTDLGDVMISGFFQGANKFYAYGAALYSWDGVSWGTPIDTGEITGLTEGASGRLFASRRSLDPISGEAGIFISDNGGSTWDSLLSFTNTFDSEYYFLPHCLSSHGASIIAVLHTLAFQTYTDRYFLYFSSDNGTSWHVTETVNYPAFINFSGGAFYMGTYGAGLYRSNDDGASWLPQTGLNSKSDVTSLVKTGSWMFASVVGNGIIADGIYGSGNNGSSWNYLNDGINTIMGPLASDGTYLYSCGPGVWKRPLSELGVTDSKISPIASALELYPNPAGEIIHLHVNSSYPLHGTLFVTNERGTVVMEEEINGISDREDILLPLAGFCEGGYHAIVLDKSGFEIGSSQFVVIRK